MTSRIALITDIHGNLPGLMTVWEDLRTQGCDRVICLGDLVDGGEHNNEVVRFVRDNDVPCVVGNHDENLALDLAVDVRDFLSALPQSLTEGDVLYTHISPRPSQRKIVDAFEAWNVFDEHPHRLTFVGHAHIPLIFGQRSLHAATATDYPFRYNEPFMFESVGSPFPSGRGFRGRSDRYVVAVGAVGYPRDGIRFPRYAIYDEDAQSVEMRLIDGPVLPYG